MILYHTTSRDVATKIMHSGKFIRGTGGMCGGGIYFATTVSNTLHKEQSSATFKSVLEVRVLLGKVKTVSATGDRSITFASLQKEGYDSVLMPRANGDEYIVYNSDQATPIKVM